MPKLLKVEYFPGFDGRTNLRFKGNCLKKTYNRDTKKELLQKIQEQKDEKAKARLSEKEPRKKFKSLNGFKNKYVRKNRRANIDFVEKKCLIDYLYVGGYGSHRRGGLKPGSRRPRCTRDPKTMMSFLEASGRAGLKMSTAKRIH